MLEIKEDYEVVQEDTHPYCMLLLELPKEVLHTFKGVHRLSINFLRRTYVKVTYSTCNLGETKKEISVTFNLNSRSEQRVKQIIEYLAEEGFEQL